MISITAHNADDKKVALEVYSVAVTDSINSYPTVSFVFNATGHNATVEDILDQGSIFTIGGQDYRFTSSNPVPNSRFRQYTVTGTHIGSMLQDNYISGTVTGSQSLDNVCKLMIQGLDNFNYQIDGDFADHDFGNDTVGNGHGEDILNTIVNTWSCEYRFDNRTIHIVKAVGKGEDKSSFLFVDGVNTNKISWTEDYTDFKTAIHAYGKELEQTISTGSGNVSTTAVNGDWSPVFRLAAYMMDVKVSDDDIKKMVSQAMHESSGIEDRIQEVWDINMAMGNPAKGLFQFIPQTFNKYAVEGYKNILKGLDQALACFNIPNFINQITGNGGWSPTGAPRMSAPAHSADSYNGGGSVSKMIEYAKTYLGVPYVWGGLGGSRGGDGHNGTDCSGLVSDIYKHYGINIPAYTVAMESCGHEISRSDVQFGDMGFFGPHGGTYHVYMAISNEEYIAEPQPGQTCYIGKIDEYPASFWLRNDQMAALVGNGGSGGTSGDSSSDTIKYYSCQTDYISPLANKVNIGKRWADPVSSDTIEKEDELLKWVKPQLHDYPDVEYSVDWVSFTRNAGGYVNDISIGNYGWLRDRYGLDVKVRLKAYTKYLDNSDPANVGSVTFGNTTTALRDISSMLVSDLTSLRNASKLVNDWIGNRMRISSSDQEWLNQVNNKKKNDEKTDSNK